MFMCRFSFDDVLEEIVSSPEIKQSRSVKKMKEKIRQTAACYTYVIQYRVNLGFHGDILLENLQMGAIKVYGIYT